jgi:hypothetical protein
MTGDEQRDGERTITVGPGEEETNDEETDRADDVMRRLQEQRKQAQQRADG